MDKLKGLVSKIPGKVIIAAVVVAGVIFVGLTVYNIMH